MNQIQKKPLLTGKEVSAWMIDTLNQLVIHDRLNSHDRYQITDSNRPMLTDVKNWIMRNSDGNLNPAKGIMFLGEKGTGKTLMIELIRLALLHFWGKMLNAYNSTYITKNYYSKPEITDNYSLGYQLHYYRFIAINDIGFERDFKDGSSIIQEILFDRFEKRLYTFGTTNLSQAELFERYNDDKNRMADRYKQMFNYVILTGKSFR